MSLKTYLTGQNARDRRFIQSTSKFCLLHLVSHVWIICKLVFSLLLSPLVAYRAHNHWYLSDLIPDWFRYIWSALELSVFPLPVDLRLSTLPSLICHWWAERSQWSNEGGTAEGNNNCHRWSEWWPFSSSISSSLQQAALCCCRLTEWWNVEGPTSKPLIRIGCIVTGPIRRKRR